MPLDRFLIAPLKNGFQTDLPSWMIPDDAFEELRNAYVFRGRLRKRFGSLLMGEGYATGAEAQLYSRLRIPLSGGAGVGTTDANGDATGTVPGAVFKVGQMFSIGDEIFTVTTAGVTQVMLTTGAATVHTYSTTNGVYAFEDADPNTQVYFYPAEPVMGITQFETGTINNRQTFAFDTQFAYLFAGGFWQWVGPTAGSYWHGDNADFFWATNWNGASVDQTYLFVTNHQAAIGASLATDDPMWYYTGAAWAQFQPVFIVGANYVKTARFIVPFKDRLLLLNTIENDAGGGLGTNTAYVNRCRYSHNGSPLAASAYYEPNQVGFTGGGYVDAATEEEIVSIGFIKDRLIVYFERSTWELAYTGNQLLPFVWQKINSELGSESAFSSVEFDKTILTVGATGAHACSGANVERIDEKIPEQVFEIKNSASGNVRVAGIRDYETEMVYWSYPSNTAGNYQTFPNEVLVFNYRNGGWAINDDTITAFGYFEQQSGRTWASTQLAWQECGFSWASGFIQAQSRRIIGGNQQGYMFIIDPDVTRNAQNMQITDVAQAADEVTLTIIDHNLVAEDHIKIKECQGSVELNGNIYEVWDVVDKDNVIINEPTAITAYTGGGTCGRVSRIVALTKRFNPYIKYGRNVFVSRIEFAVQRTYDGEITVDYFPSSTVLSMMVAGQNTGMNLGTSILETRPYELDADFEELQHLLWHTVYFQTEGQYIQFSLYFNDEQMADPDIAEAAFELEGMILYTEVSGKL